MVEEEGPADCLYKLSPGTEGGGQRGKEREKEEEKSKRVWGKEKRKEKGNKQTNKKEGRKQGKKEKTKRRKKEGDDEMSEELIITPAKFRQYYPRPTLGCYTPPRSISLLLWQQKGGRSSRRASFGVTTVTPWMTCCAAVQRPGCGFSYSWVRPVWICAGVETTERWMVRHSSSTNGAQMLGSAASGPGIRTEGHSDLWLKKCVTILNVDHRLKQQPLDLLATNETNWLEKVQGLFH